MAAPNAPGRIVDAIDITQPLTVGITLKRLPGTKVMNAGLAGAVAAAATTLIILNPEAISNPAGARPIANWLTALCSYTLDSGALQETVTVTGVVFSNLTATLTCTATAFAHSAGANMQITEVVGNTGASTFTFAAGQQANKITSSIAEHLDWALRDTSATVA